MTDTMVPRLRTTTPQNPVSRGTRRGWAIYRNPEKALQAHKKFLRETSIQAEAWRATGETMRPASFNRP